MRLIDADALEKKLHELALDEWNHGPSTSWSNAYLECEDMVYNAPTVDAIEIVRCKDCVYQAECAFTEWLGRNGNGFCSCGERRKYEAD